MAALRKHCRIMLLRTTARGRATLRARASVARLDGMAPQQVLLEEAAAEAEFRRLYQVWRSRGDEDYSGPSTTKVASALLDAAEMRGAIAPFAANARAEIHHAKVMCMARWSMSSD